MAGDERIKVLHINLSPPGKGGIERLLVGFFECLHGDEFEVSLAILSGESATSQELSERGCKVWNLQRKAEGFDWGLYPRLVRLLRSYQPQVVHIHGNPGLIYGVPACRWAGVRNLIYTCHFSQSDRSWIQHTALAGLLRLVRRPVAVSEAARQVLTAKYHLPADRIEVVYNGVDLDRFAVRPADDGPRAEGPVIGFCGVFRPEKQIPTLIEAFARIRQQGFPATLLLVGDGPTMADCRQAIRQHGIADHVRLVGEQTEVRRFVRKMDIFVLPSSQEAMPVALLEAMALERAVVASAVGGIPEIVTDQVSGLLVRSGDVPELTTALSRLLRDPAWSVYLGQAARQRIVQHFSLTRMMSRYAEIYRELCERETAKGIGPRLAVSRSNEALTIKS